MTDLVVRPAEKHDMPALLELYEHLNAGDMPYSPDKAAAIFERFQRYEGSVILLGVIDARPVASCTLVIVPNLTRGGASYALIENVVTHSAYRNRGFGKAILQAAVRKAWAEGCYKAMLMTGSKEASTLAFYASAGFEQSKKGFQIRRPPARSE